MATGDTLASGRKRSVVEAELAAAQAQKAQVEYQMSTTNAQAEADAQQLIEEVNNAWALARDAADTSWYTVFTDPTYFFVGSGSKEQAYAALGNMKPQIDTWATRNLAWARAGKRDDGTAFTWKQWFSLGEVFLNSSSYIRANVKSASVVKQALTKATDALTSLLAVLQQLLRIIQNLLNELADKGQMILDAAESLSKYAGWILLGVGALYAAPYLTGAVVGGVKAYRDVKQLSGRKSPRRNRIARRHAR